MICPRCDNGMEKYQISGIKDARILSRCPKCGFSQKEGEWD